MKNYINVKFFLVRNIKTRTNWFNLGHQDSITKSRTALAKSRQLECLEIYQQNFRKTTSKKSIFKVGDSESIRKILEEHLQRNLHFRKKAFCICEQNLWNTPVKELCFSVYHTPGYICDCSQCTTLKMFDISFSKPSSRNSVIIHVAYNEDKIIYFLYIFFNLHIYIHIYIHTYIHTHTHTYIYIYVYIR